MLKAEVPFKRILSIEFSKNFHKMRVIMFQKRYASEAP